jgi:hypothetical protein
MRPDFRLEVGGFFGSTKEIQDDGRFVWIQQNPIKKHMKPYETTNINSLENEFFHVHQTSFRILLSCSSLA